jgi:hypothetical protein
MTQITVTPQAGGTFRVQTPAGTSHEVSVPPGFAASLGCGDVDPSELVRASFEFLLERESATSILREFSLDVISHYFPSYPAEIGARLRGGDPGTPQVGDPPASGSPRMPLRAE